MVKWFKKHFIPHEGNDHKPHFLRSETVVVILGFVLFIEVIFLLEVFILFPNTDFLALIMPPVLVDEINAGRTVNNLEELKVNPLLERAAKLKASDMASKSYFSHDSPGGKMPWYWLEQVGYDYVYAGENLAVNFIDSEDVVTAWMNSPTHRANILNDKFSEVGIAAARGTYEGRETTFVVQFFGKPVLAALPPSEIPDEAREIAPAPATSVAEVTPQVRGETTIITKTFSKPRTVTDYLYFAFIALVVLALILNIFIKIRVQHPVLIANGVLVITIIGLTLLVNEIVALFQAQIL